MQAAACHHSSAWVRRHALGILDHVANDESAATFRAALADPVPRVRMAALHGLSCERCRVGDLEVDDVVADLVEILEHDDSPKVRHAAIDVLGRLTSRDARVIPALETAASSDADEHVRIAALGAARSTRPTVWSRKAVRRRTQATAHEQDQRRRPES
jgi:HEAT repeat protein